MHDLSLAGPVDWFEFQHDGELFRVNITFLASNWRCLYGRGCPGMFSAKSKHTVPDLGCCTGGFYLDGDEYDDIDRRVKQLTAKDWDDNLFAEYVNRRGAWTTNDRKKSRVVDGGCIFANRADGSVGKTGKIGCAFLHLGNRLNQERNDLMANSEEHEDFMPRVCSQLPLYQYWDADDVRVVTAWSNDQWTGGEPRDDDGTSSSHHHWWCVDGPDNYSSNEPLYISMERELKRIVSDDVYYLIVEYIESKDSNSIAPMPPTPEGRALIALLGMPQPPEQTIVSQVGDRTPKRPLP